jgi:hypothetical protein
MSHYAKINDKNIVVEVLVIEQDQIDTGRWGDPSKWIQTSYNTRGGVHLLGGTPLRKNFAGIGYKYDSVLDAFIPPQTIPGTILNPDTGLWDYPIPMPDDGNKYVWIYTQWIQVPFTANV